MKNSTSPNLIKQVVRGGGWLLFNQGYERIISVIKTIVLARFLSPENFGIFGVCILIISTLDVMSETGFQSALIQKQQKIDDYLDSVWTITVLRGIVQFLLIYFFAPAIASFFNIADSVFTIRIISISLLFQGLQNIKVIQFKKELAFDKQFYLRFWVTTLDLAVSLTLAFILKNELALVYGYLGGSFAGLISSYWLIPYFPKFSFNIRRLKELSNFGKWIFLSNIVAFINNNGDDAFVGKCLGTSNLGFYQMAFKFGNMQSSVITTMIKRVAFPSFSKLQNNKERLKESYLRLLSFNVSLVVPLSVAIILTASLFTSIFLGDKWLPIIRPLQIFTLSGLMRSILGVGGSLFLATGNPKLAFRINFLRLIVIFSLIYPFSMHYNFTGAALAVLSGNLIALIIWLFYSIKITRASLLLHINAFLPALFSIIPACLMMYFILIFNPLSLIEVIQFITIIVAGITIYLFIQYIIRNHMKFSLFNEMKNIMVTLTKKE